MIASSLQAPLRLALLTGIFAAGAYLQARGLLSGVLKHWPDIVYLSRQHLGLVAMSGGIAIAIGLPLGVLLTRPAIRPFANAVTQVVNLGTTIPTLAILALEIGRAHV